MGFNRESVYRAVWSLADERRALVYDLLNSEPQRNSDLRSRIKEEFPFAYPKFKNKTAGLMCNSFNSDDMELVCSTSVNVGGSREVQAWYSGRDYDKIVYPLHYLLQRADASRVGLRHTFGYNRGPCNAPYNRAEIIRLLGNEEDGTLTVMELSDTLGINRGSVIKLCDRLVVSEDVKMGQMLAKDGKFGYRFRKEIDLTKLRKRERVVYAFLDANSETYYTMGEMVDKGVCSDKSNLHKILEKLHDAKVIDKVSKECLVPISITSKGRNRTLKRVIKPVRDAVVESEISDWGFMTESINWSRLFSRYRQ